MRRRFFFFFLISSISYGQNSFPPIGMWREHLPYQNALDLTASEKKIYCATPYSLFSVDLLSGETERISKVSGLSETGISTIEYDPLSRKLYVAYANSNIDLIDQQGIHNIPDLKRKPVSGDKTIYQVYPDNSRCYLATGMGVLVLDAERNEFADSWYIGQAGGPVKTNAFIKNNGFFYAATEEGLKTIPAAGSNPADFHNWYLVSGTGGLPAGAARSAVAFNNKTIVLQNDSLYAENGGSWDLYFANGWPVVSIHVSGSFLFICQRQATGASQVLALRADGSVQKIIREPGIISFPRKAISINNDLWVADLYGGLSHWTASGQHELYRPGSPAGIANGGMTVYHHTLYATAGSVNDSWNYQYNRGGIFKLYGSEWFTYNQYSFPPLDTLMDFITVAVDPRDESLWAGSYGGGLLHIKGKDQLEIFKQNSPLGATVGDPTSYRVAGLAFDRDQNLWVANFGSDHPLHVLKKDGSWRSFTPPFLLSLNAAAQIVIDNGGRKWITSPLNNGLMVFDDASTLDNTADDRWRLYRKGAGQGNLPSSQVRAIALDKSGFIWIGTSDGMAVIQCPEEAFGNTCEAMLPVISEGGFANYLFKGQDIRSIAVDGADNKWVATARGAWYISPEGDKVLGHFTEDNSALLSDDVKSIAIDGQTGEVFFATAMGLCSFRGRATEAEETKDLVLVFPNPVPPDYRGSIGIRGLPDNSQVKITETNGRLVFQTRSYGGQAIWDGRDYRGRPAASGVYLVLAVDEEKKEKVVAKIVFIGK